MTQIYTRILISKDRPKRTIQPMAWDCPTNGKWESHDWKDICALVDLMIHQLREVIHEREKSLIYRSSPQPRGFSNALGIRIRNLTNKSKRSVCVCACATSGKSVTQGKTTSQYQVKQKFIWKPTNQSERRRLE